MKGFPTEGVRDLSVPTAYSPVNSCVSRPFINPSIFELQVSLEDYWFCQPISSAVYLLPNLSSVYWDRSIFGNDSIRTHTHPHRRRHAAGGA